MAGIFVNIGTALADIAMFGTDLGFTITGRGDGLDDMSQSNNVANKDNARQTQEQYVNAANQQGSEWGQGAPIIGSSTLSSSSMCSILCLLLMMTIMVAD